MTPDDDLAWLTEQVDRVLEGVRTGADVVPPFVVGLVAAALPVLIVLAVLVMWAV